MAVEPKEYTKLAAEIMAVRAKKETPLAMVRTYGCQQNVSDGEKIKGMLQQMGFGFTEDQEEADFILFNTCAIREHAEDRIFGNVGALKYLKRRNPSLIIALCGCMMEQEHVVERIRKSYPFVSLVFGTHSLSSFPQLVYETLTGAKRVFQRGGEDTIDENIPVRRDGRFKAWLPVMYGCDNFCSYCVVPYVRGRERSREPEAVLKEARQLIEGGYKDITLLGQNVNSYGKNLPEPGEFRKAAQGNQRYGGGLLAAVYDQPPQGLHQRADRRDGFFGTYRKTSAPPLPVGQQPGAEGDEPALYSGTVFGNHPLRQGEDARPFHHQRHHRRLSGRDL